jgi:predicted permease
MDFSAIFNQIIVLFIMMFLGYLASKLNIIDDHTSRKLSSFVVKITAPALVVNAMLAETTLSGQEITNIILIALGVYVFLFIMTLFVPKALKVSKKEIGIYKFMIMFSNVAFMGFPVAEAIFGMEGILYAAIFNLPFYFLVYTLGIYFVSENEETKFELKKMINAPVIAIAVGLMLFILGVKLPEFINMSLDMVGSVTTPISMIVIGASLSNVQFKSVVSNLKLYIYSFLKLLLFPFIIFMVLKGLGFEGLMLGVPVIISGMPVAANAVILSKEYDGDDILASEGTFVSTLLSIISIPILVFMLSL